MYKLLIATVLAMAVSRCDAEERIFVDLVSEPLVKQRLASGQVNNQERQAAIRGLFESVGCSTTEERVDKHSDNVICTLPGETESTIIVGGHFDFVDRGAGIVDDWSGASLLSSLYQALKGKLRKHTFIFVAFAAEEVGLVGSHRYVKDMGGKGKRVRAFVNLECLGLSPVKVWARRSTMPLIQMLGEVAQATGIPIQGVNVDRVGDDDTHAFLAANIPVISIHSLTQDTFPILHSKRDRLEAIRFDDYYDAYKLAAYYLAYLDVKLERSVAP